VDAAREKHHVFKRKENAYWESTVKANSTNPRKLWQSISTILGKPPGQSSVIPSFTASEFLQFMENKVESVRKDTEGSTPPHFEPTDCVFDTFAPCSQEAIRKMIGGAQSKSCDLDPIPTSILKVHLDTLLPYLTRMCNMSIREGSIPSSQTTAIVTPRLKKAGLDATDMQNFRPISNLSFMSKVVERIVASQLLAYLNSNSLLPKLQSGFRSSHSTESALLRVLSDIFSAIDKQQITLLALLDVSAAFDTVDHPILLGRLSTSFGIDGSAFAWIRSFIIGRTLAVHHGSTASNRVPVRSGVPQGSVLGPLLYILYTADISRIVEQLGFGVHLYADDVQLYVSGNALASSDLASRALQAIDSVRAWMSSNRLRLNPSKTQFIWLGTRQQLAKQDAPHLSTILTPSEMVVNLGLRLDPELTLCDHVTKLSQTCFFHLRRLRAVRYSLTSDALLTLVHSFVCNRVDYCNSALFGVGTSIVNRLQSILNSAARLILRIPKFDHISSAIRNELHWLPVRRRIDYKLCMMVRNSLTGSAPAYLAELCVPSSSRSGRQHLRSANRGDLLIPLFRTEYGRRGFSVAGPQLWNSLPPNIRQLLNKPELFKKSLKTFFFGSSA
jgi:hypothetical protein